MKSIKLIIVFLCALLVACSASMPNAKILSEEHAKVEKIAVVTFWGELPRQYPEAEFYNKKLPEAFQKRFKPFFDRNGLFVTECLTSNKPISTLKAAESVAAVARLNADPSHVLIINGQGFTLFEKTWSFAKFEFVLYDIKFKKIIWKGNPEVALITRQPLLRTESMAASTLQSFHDFGLYPLSRGYVVGMDDAKWTGSSQYATDK